MKRIVCADALEWLEGQRNVGSIVTSLPDAEEIGATLLDWSAWYKRAVGYAGSFSRTIVDPFCGRGSVPAIADAMGFDAIGVDIDPEQCRHAEALSVSADEVSE